jgi:hypothetical protein
LWYQNSSWTMHVKLATTLTTTLLRSSHLPGAFRSHFSGLLGFLVRFFSAQKIMENVEIIAEIIFHQKRHFYASKLSGMSFLPSISRGAKGRTRLRSSLLRSSHSPGPFVSCFGGLFGRVPGKTFFRSKINENVDIISEIIFCQNRHFYASKLSGMSILPSKSRGAKGRTTKIVLRTGPPRLWYRNSSWMMHVKQADNNPAPFIPLTRGLSFQVLVAYLEDFLVRLFSAQKIMKMLILSQKLFFVKIDIFMLQN